MDGRPIGLAVATLVALFCYNALLFCVFCLTKPKRLGSSRCLVAVGVTIGYIRFLSSFADGDLSMFLRSVVDVVAAPPPYYAAPPACMTRRLALPGMPWKRADDSCSLNFLYY